MIDLAMLVAIGLVMGFLGPFASERASAVQRYVYWMICMVGGGLIGIGVDAALARPVPAPWLRTAVVSVAMTPLVSLFVLATEHLVMDGTLGPHAYGRLLWQVHRSWWVAAEAVEAVRWRRGAGEASLAGGLVAPVSRTYAPLLKEAGWF